tara:strand:- start:335 stop:1459 length:1125 start_codon:yes stop_codon:yes gene_type:complete
MFKENIYFGLLAIYFSLLINLIFSIDIANSFLRNVFFIKYLIFVLGTISFISEKKFRLSFLYKSWILIITIFAIDMFVQFFLGKNIIGLESPLKFHRVSGFMGDELKSGSLLISFSLIISGFLINNKKYKNIGLILIIFFISAIFISGDRSNFIKSLIVIFFILFFLKKEFLKKLFFLAICLFIFIFSIISNYETFSLRYKNDLFSKFASNNYNFLNYMKTTEYGKIYHTGIVLFQNNKLFGVGNKNFRLLCNKNEREKFLRKNKIDYEKNFVDEKYFEKFRCNTHPHQIYIEILSEHGIFGFTILMFLLIIFIKQNIFIILKKRDLLLACQFLVILINFIPILPGGSFFSSFNATLFWTNIALFYSYKKIISK